LLRLNKKLTINKRAAGQVSQAFHHLINRCEQQSLEPQKTPVYFCMNYYTAMMQSFEKEKNRRAALITGGIALAMVLAFILIKFHLPKIEIPPPQMYVEVDLEDLM